MQNARLGEAQDGIKISGRNINNLRYADDSTLMAGSKEELKTFLMKVKEESEKVGLKLSFFLVAVREGYSSVAVCGLLIVMAFLVVEHRP